MSDLQEYKFNLKLQFANNIENAFMSLLKDLNSNLSSFNNLILLYGRFSDIKQSINKNTVSQADRNLEIANIRGAVIELIDELSESELKLFQPVITQMTTVETVIDAEDELGYFDLLDMSQNAFQEMTDIISKITEYNTELGDNIKYKTDEMNRIKNASKNPKKEGTVIMIRKLFAKTAEILAEHNAKMSIELSTFKRLSDSCLKNYEKAISIAYNGELTIEQIQDLKTIHLAVLRLKAASQYMKDSFSKLIEVVTNLPNLEINFNKARKNTKAILTTFNSTLVYFLEDANLLLENIEFSLKQHNEAIPSYDLQFLLEQPIE